MAVSLKKPPKVDLSKPPLHNIDVPECMLIREITPEHLLEEYSPPEKLKELTPKHVAAEVIPKRTQNFENLESEHFESNHSELGILVIAIVAIISMAIVIVCGFITFDPSDYEAASIAVSNIYELFEQVFAFFSKSPFIMFLLSFSFLSVAFRFILKIGGRD